MTPRLSYVAVLLLAPFATGCLELLALAAPEEPSDAVGTMANEDYAEVSVDPSEFEDTDPAALTEFREPLAPYGTWTEDPTYGTVWVPSQNVVGTDFAPYVSAGHWTYGTDYVWVSDYTWGTIPFHYGRWVWINNLGQWAWIPGRRYAGAWVDWRVGDAGYGYVGWAPTPPSYYWRSGVVAYFDGPQMAAYTFCAVNDLFHSDLWGRRVTGPQVAAIGGNTHPHAPVVAPPARTAASPSVEGRVVADPTVAGRVVANPAPVPGPRKLGPLPGSLGYQAQIPAAPAHPFRTEYVPRSVLAGGSPPSTFGTASHSPPSFSHRSPSFSHRSPSFTPHGSSSFSHGSSSFEPHGSPSFSRSVSPPSHSSFSRPSSSPSRPSSSPSRPSSSPSRPSSSPSRSRSSSSHRR